MSDEKFDLDFEAEMELVQREHMSTVMGTVPLGPRALAIKARANILARQHGVIRTSYIRALLKEIEIKDEKIRKAKEIIGRDVDKLSFIDKKFWESL